MFYSDVLVSVTMVAFGTPFSLLPANCFLVVVGVER